MVPTIAWGPCWPVADIAGVDVATFWLCWICCNKRDLATAL